MKNTLLKILILLNSSYFLFALKATYSLDKTHYRSIVSLRQFFKQFEQSAIREEYGLIIYIMAIALFLVNFITKQKMKWLWSLISLIPILYILILGMYYFLKT